MHAEELSFWFAADAARRKARHGYRLVQTVWETLPFLHTYRNRHARRYRAGGARGHRPLPAGHGARPRGAAARGRRRGADRRSARRGSTSSRFGRARRDAARRARDPLAGPARVGEGPPGRAARRRAARARGPAAAGADRRPRARGGPRCAPTPPSSGSRDRVEIGAVPYDEMPAAFAHRVVHGARQPAARQRRAAPLRRAAGVLGGAVRHGPRRGDGRRASTSLAADSGAIPEVLDGQGTLFASGDWPGLARRLREGPLARPPGERVAYPAELVERYSTSAAAGRLAAAYERARGPEHRAQQGERLARRALPRERRRRARGRAARRRRPRRRRVRTAASASRSARTSCGSTSSAASPATSGRLETPSRSPPARPPPSPPAPAARSPRTATGRRTRPRRRRARARSSSST